MIRLHVFQAGSEFSAVYPARKPSEDGATLVDYFAQGREKDAATLANRVTKGMKLKAALVFVPSSPVSIGRALGATADASHVGYLTDDAAALSAELASKPSKPSK